MALGRTAGGCPHGTRSLPHRRGYNQTSGASDRRQLATSRTRVAARRSRATRQVVFGYARRKCKAGGRRRGNLGALYHARQRALLGAGETLSASRGSSGRQTRITDVVVMFRGSVRSYPLEHTEIKKC